VSDEAQIAALVDECQRQSESCTYTAAAFLIWLRWLKTVRLVCAVAPVVFGAVATWKAAAQGSPGLAAVCALLTTVIPLAYRASKTDRAIEDYTVAAGEFTNLRDRFRQAAEISSKKSLAEFEADAKPLLARLEKARTRALTPPEWCFKRAQRKIKKGDYRHDHDAEATSGS
jgi:hypothetical protein